MTATMRFLRPLPAVVLFAGISVLVLAPGRPETGPVQARVHTSDGEDLSELLKRAGLGRSYDGGRRPLWCDGP